MRQEGGGVGPSKARREAGDHRIEEDCDAVAHPEKASGTSEQDRHQTHTDQRTAIEACLPVGGRGAAVGFGTARGGGRLGEDLHLDPSGLSMMARHAHEPTI